MSERVKQLLFSLQNGQRAAESGASGAELDHVIRQVTQTVDKAVKSPEVVLDEKLTCLSLFLDSDDPPDVLSFLLWRGAIDEKDANTAKGHLIKFLYDYVKEYGDSPKLFKEYKGRVLEAAWGLGRSLESRAGETKAVALHVCTLIFRLYPELLWELVPLGDGELVARWESLLDTLLGNLFQTSKCTGTYRRYHLIFVARLIQLVTRRSTDIALSADQETFLQKSAEKLIGTCAGDLTKNIKQLAKGQKADKEAITGAFAALSISLDFSEGCYRSTAERKQLFRDHLKSILDNLFQFQRYGDVGRKACKLLAHHASFFQAEIAEDPKGIYETVKKVLEVNAQKSNATLGKYAMAAMNSLLEVIAGLQLKKADLDVFLSIFGKGLDRAMPPQYEALIILRVVVSFAAKLLDRTIEESESRLLGRSDAAIRLLGRLSSFSDRILTNLLNDAGPFDSKPMRWRATVLDAAGSILRAAGATSERITVPSSMVDWLAQVMQALVDQYFSIRTEREQTCIGMNSVFTALAARAPDTLDPLFAQVVPPSLIRAITREDISKPGTLQAVVYASMWRRVLRPGDREKAYDNHFFTRRSYRAGPVKMNEEEAIIKRVLQTGFRHILLESLELINRLDLTYTFRVGGGGEGLDAGGDGSEAMIFKPRKEMDHELFLGVVDFLAEFLDDYECNLQAKWALETVRPLVRKSVQLSHVSGFYHLLSRTFQALEKVNGLDPAAGHMSEADTKSLASLCSRYVLHVATQLDQYQDELLAAALDMLLNVPQHILRDLSPLIPAIRLALTTGVSHTATANAAISALERWLKTPSLRCSLDDSLPAILPLLDLYIYDAERMDTGSKGRVEKEYFQQRVLRLLGRMGGKNQAILSDMATALSGSLAWDTKTRIHLEVPLASHTPRKIEVDLDHVLPRLLRLAERKGDPQVKVLASECIHAVVIFMVGLGKGLPTGSRGFTDTYEHVMPTLLRLALDFNVTTRQLFTKFVQQLIHWFSKRPGIHPETAALLESLTDGLGSSESGPIRNFCAAGVGEFIKYAVKQKSKSEMSKDPASLDNLMKRLFSLARHPNRYKRLGAAMGMQYALRHVRDETALRHRFLLQLFHVTMCSLQYSHADNESFGTVELLSRLADSMLGTIERAVVEKGDKGLLVHQKGVCEPCRSLGEMVEWLWGNIGAIETAFRRKCMDAFVKLCNLLPECQLKGGDKPPRIWMLRHSAREVQRVAETAAASPLNELRTHARPTLGALTEALNVVAAAVDVYCFLFDRDILHPRAFFSGEEPFQGEATRPAQEKRWASSSSSEELGASSSLSIFTAIQTLVDKVWSTKEPVNYEDRFNLLASEATMLRHKNAVTLRGILDFLDLLMRKDGEHFSALLSGETGVWGPVLQTVLFEVLLCPWEMGIFNRPEDDEEVELFLRSSAVRLSRHWKDLDRQVAKHQERLTITARGLLERPSRPNLFRLAGGLPQCDTTARMQLVSACDTLATVDLLRHILTIPDDVHKSLEAKGCGLGNMVEGMACYLAWEVAELPMDLSPSVQCLASSILRLAIKLGLPIVETSGVSLLILMRLDTNVPETCITKGQLFQRRFNAEIAEALLGPRGRPHLADLTREPGALHLFLGLIDHLLAQPIFKEEAALAVLGLAASKENEEVFDLTLKAGITDESVTQTVAVLHRLLRLEAALPHLRRIGLHAKWPTSFFQRCIIKELSAATKAQCLKLARFLLPGFVANAFVAFEESDQTVHLVDAIDDGIMAQHFPAGGPEELKSYQQFALLSEYQLLLSAVIDTVAATANIPLLIKLIMHFKNEGQKHLFYSKLRIGLRSMVNGMQNADPKAYVRFAHEILAELQGRNLKGHTTKIIVLDLVLLPLMSSFSLDLLETFYTEPSPRAPTSGPLIRTLVASVPERVPESSLTDSGLFTIVCSLDLLRVLYERLSKSVVRGKINQAYIGKADQAEGNELLTAVAKRARAAYRIRDRGTASNHVRLRFCSSAFSCVAATVIKTQENQKALQTYLLKPEEMMDFWENLVDKEAKFIFGSTDPEAAETTAPKRHTNRVQRSGADLRGDFTFRLQIGTTQASMLSMSSLSQAASSQSMSEHEFEAKVKEKEESQSIRGASVVLADDDLSDGDTTELTLGQDGIGWAHWNVLLEPLGGLNRQPCMPAMLEMIQKLRSLMRATDEELRGQPKPEWLDLLVHEMENEDKHHNVRLFILQLFLNQPVAEAVAPWCSKLGGAVLKVSNDLLFDPERGHGLHYMLLDVARLFLSDWSSYKPSGGDINLAARFLCQIFGRMHHNSQPVLRRNLGCADGLIKAWARGQRDMTRTLIAELNNLGTIKTIVDLLASQQGMVGSSHAKASSRGSKNQRRALTALNTLAMLLTVGVNLTSKESECANRLCSLVLKAITDGSKPVYELGSETCGLILYAMEKHKQDEEQEPSAEAKELERNVTKALMASAGEVKFLHCLRGLTRYYPNIINKDSRLLFESLMSTLGHKRIVDGVAKAGALNILRTLPYAQEEEDNLYAQLRTIIKSAITDTSQQYIERQWRPYVQMRALELLHTLLTDMEVNQLCKELNDLLEPGAPYNLSVLATSHSTDTACRRELFNMLMMAFLKLRQAPQGEVKDSLMGKTVLKALRRCLIAGLTDPDDVGVDEPPSKAGEPPVEQGVRRRLLDFWDSEQMLPLEPLDRLEGLFTHLFHPESADAWLGASAYILLSLAGRADEYDEPLFREALMDCDFRDMAVTTEGADGSVPSTMTPLFSLQRTQPSQSQSFDSRFGTQSVDVSQVRAGYIRATQAGGWTQTQQAYDPFAPQASETSQVETRFLVDLGAGVTAPSQQPMGPPAGRGTKRKATDSVEGDGTTTVPDLPIRQSKQRKLVVYRKYREGELPDIQIPRRDVLRPLQGLCLRDQSVAKSLLGVLFPPIFEALGTADPTGQRQTTLLDRMQELMRAARGNTDVVACLHTMYRAAMSSPSYRASNPSHELSPAVIADSGLASLNFHSGVVVLEEYILRLQSESRPTTRAVSRRRSGGGRPSPDQEAADGSGASQDVWLQLSRLYRALGEKDIVLGLSERICPDDRQHLETEDKTDKPSTYRALEWDLSGEYQRAAKEYENLISSSQDKELGWEVSEQEAYAWQLRQMECLARLGNWDGLYRVTSGDSTLWDKDNQSQVLPYHAQSLVMLASSKGHQIDDILGDTRPGGKVEVLQATMPSHLAALHLYRGDLTRALAQVERSYRHFLTSWAGLHPCALSARKSQLQGLQFILEVEDSVNLKRAETAARVEQLVQKWESNLPSIENDSTITWETISENRLWTLGPKLGKTEEEPDVMVVPKEVPVEKLFHHHSLLFVEATHAAVQQRDRFMGYNFLKRCSCWQQQLSNEDEANTGLCTRELLALLDLRRLQLAKVQEMGLSWQEIEGRKSVNMEKRLFINNLTVIKQYLTKPEDIGKVPEPDLLALKAQWSESFLDHISRSLCEARETGKAVSDSLKLSRELYLELIAEPKEAALPKDSTDLFSFQQLVCKHAYDAYLSATEDTSRNVVPPARLSGTHRSFARFCDRLLTDEKEVAMASGMQADGLAATAVENYLKAAMLAPGAAQDSIPRALMHFDDFPGTLATFDHHAVDVPTWAFLCWVPQLLALLLGPQADVMIPLLERVAVEYPQALFFPFRVTREGMSEEAIRKTDRVAVKLNQQGGDVLTRFVESLENLVDPKIQVMAEVKRLQDMLKDKLELSILRQDYDKVRKAWVASSQGMGEKRDKSMTDLVKVLDQHFGKKGEKLSSDSIKKVVETIKKMKDEPSGIQPMEAFSQWLADYQMAIGGRAKIEIPGQYGGLLTQPPRPELHAHVVSLDNEVLVLGSKQRPKRITIRGDDERDHLFLVKGGEDLRQDERIEQLFEAMNLIMRADPVCRQGGLTCRTYKVLPMTTSFGMIEWVPNTRVLKEMISDGLKDASTKARSQSTSRRSSSSSSQGGKDIVPLNDQYGMYADKIKVKDVPSYHKMYGKMSAADAAKNLNEMQALLPRDVIRNHLMLMAPASEAFVTLRNEFAKSLATFNICSYVAGVGDRHLENFLFDSRSGAIIGIDFGYAFGVGTSQLPVPELIPFRLTRQFTGVLQPLDSVGLMKTSMVHVMSALRASREVLASLMEIYVKEPVLDWTGAHKGKSTEGQRSNWSFAEGEDLKALTSWEPARKIAAARWKLEGVSPMFIMQEDLKQNPIVHRCKTLPSLTDVVFGSTTEAKRWLIEKRGTTGRGKTKERRTVLSVTDQVDCLVDMATDPNILGRQYEGLATWV